MKTFFIWVSATIIVFTASVNVYAQVVAGPCVGGTVANCEPIDYEYDFSTGANNADLDNDGISISTDIDDQNIIYNLCIGTMQTDLNYLSLAWGGVGAQAYLCNGGANHFNNFNSAGAIRGEFDFHASGNWVGGTQDYLAYITFNAPPPPDQCTNIDGIQLEIPENYEDINDDGTCTEIDVCINIDGNQYQIPQYFEDLNDDGVCTQIQNIDIAIIEAINNQTTTLIASGLTFIIVGGIAYAFRFKPRA